MASHLLLRHKVPTPLHQSVETSSTLQAHKSNAARPWLGHVAGQNQRIMWTTPHTRYNKGSMTLSPLSGFVYEIRLRYMYYIVYSI